MWCYFGFRDLPGTFQELWARILMAFPLRLAVQHLLYAALVRGLIACPRSPMRPRESGT